MLVVGHFLKGLGLFPGRRERAFLAEETAGTKARRLKTA